MKKSRISILSNLVDMGKVEEAKRLHMRYIYRDEHTTCGKLSIYDVLDMSTILAIEEGEEVDIFTPLEDTVEDMSCMIEDTTDYTIEDLQKVTKLEIHYEEHGCVYYYIKKQDGWYTSCDGYCCDCIDDRTPDCEEKPVPPGYLKDRLEEAETARLENTLFIITII